MTTMVDKYLAKKYVEEKIGKEYVFETLAVWNRPEDVDLDILPNQFVLKTNHDSGGIIICNDKTKINKRELQKKLKKMFRRNYYGYYREWPYKNIQKKIIAEKFMKDGSGGLKDYKLCMFNGELKCTFTCTERFSQDGLKVTFFDNDWNVMPFERHYPKSKKEIERPQSFDKMKELAQKLSNGFEFLRVDFYEVNGKPYFGEFTFFPGTGLEEFTPERYDAILGSWIHLDSK